MKTYKLFIDGKYPRTESGRYLLVEDAGGKPWANVCRASRKDFRNAVVAARKAFGGWSSRAAFNRGQIVYRMGEMLEDRQDQFKKLLVKGGMNEKAAALEVEQSIDLLISYAGWADKYQQVFSSVNPVSSSHFNFSMLEPTGVVGVLCEEREALLGMLHAVLPIVVGGNTAVVLVPPKQALPAMTFAEVLATSDVPGGVWNILTGLEEELREHFASHMDVNAVSVCSGMEENALKTVQEAATGNLKRLVKRKLPESVEADPYAIRQFQEVKTTWHPVGL